MKTLLQLKMKAGILTLILIGICAQSWAASYTASSTGNWSSNATWSGGSAPSATNTSDQITIQSGVTVTMDEDVTINGALASLDVEGTLAGETSTTFAVLTGTVSGAGSISASAVNLGTGAVLTFSGDITANTFSSTILSLDALAHITVNSGLTLSAGMFSLGSSGKLSLGNGTTITMAGGQLSAGNGKLTLPSSYNVIYTAGYSSTGAEITGSGLQNVTFNSGSGKSVQLNDNLTVNGTINLQSGTLVLNGNTLTIKGDVAANGSGKISSNTASNINISTSNTNSGSLWFNSGANSVNNFTVNITDGGWANLGSSMVVNGTLNLQKGTLWISNDTLQIAASGTITNSNSSNYVVTNSKGFLSMYVTAAASTAMSYPIGSASHFRPSNIWLNSGSNSGWVNLNVSDNVYSHGTAGTMLSSTQSMVNSTWDVQSNITSNMNLKMQMMWSASDEVNAFDRTKAYISHYTNGMWDVSATASATVEGGGMYSISRTNIQSLSPFAVFDDKTAAIDQVNNISSNTNFEIYPNPAMENIYIQKGSGSSKEMTAQIINANGQILGTYLITDKTSPIDISSLSKGLYFVKVYDNHTSTTAKFVKF